MQIHGFNKSTLLDYPRHLAATIFVGGCNLRCPFCHNASLVLRPNTQPVIPKEEVLSYLKKRRSILEGICVTGGEPTLYPELPELIGRIKELGFKVKLDTNGTNPSMMMSLVKENRIDYVAMDIKSSKENYSKACGTKDIPMEQIERSVSFLLSGKIDYEFRTTVVGGIHSEQDMVSIGSWIKGAKAYYLQSYQDSGDVILPGYSPLPKDVLLQYIELLSPFVDYVALRGVD